MNYVSASRMCSPLFAKCFIQCSMTTEYLECNFWVKNVFPKVPSRGVKVVKSQKYWTFKVLQSAPCWYSKLLSRDVWFNGKGLSSIGSSCAEKTFKMCQNIGNHQNSQFSMFLGLFLACIDPFELKLFSLNQASWETSLEYRQWVLWSTLKRNISRKQYLTQ